MVVKSVQAAKTPMAEVAFIAAAVPGAAGDLVGVGAVPSDEVLGDEAVRVLGSDEAVDIVSTVERSLGARTALEMVSQAGGGGVGVPAEGASDVLVAMLARVHVLLNAVQVHELALAILTPVVDLDFMLLAGRLGIKGVVATVALVLGLVVVRRRRRRVLVPVSEGVHMLRTSLLAAEVAIASVALIVGPIVAGGLTVLVSGSRASGEPAVAGSALEHCGSRLDTICEINSW